MNSFILPAKTICYFFNITRETLRKWKQNSTWPESAQVKRGYYNLKEIFDWRTTYIMGDADMSKRMFAAKMQREEAKAIMDKLDAEEQQKNLISIDKLKQDLNIVFVQFKMGLSLFEKRLPLLLEGKTAKEMYKIIHDEIYNVLKNFSQGTKVLCKKH